MPARNFFKFTFLSLSFFGLLLGPLLWGCTTDEKPDRMEEESKRPEVLITGAMKRVMWEGKLEGIISFDSLQRQPGLYGLGPLAGLRGEITIDDGRVYVSRVSSDTSMVVVKSGAVTAPFFVRATVPAWRTLPLPSGVSTIKELEEHLIETVSNRPEPFPFKLVGVIDSALIHVQNLPPGAQVSSPAEAHQGQTDYRIGKQKVRIIGFYSQQHRGVFTHHDSFLHLHLITDDEQLMGHLDRVSFGKMDLLIP